jgi:hypothetical protein
MLGSYFFFFPLLALRVLGWSLFFWGFSSGLGLSQQPPIVFLYYNLLNARLRSNQQIN